jgi:AcrR family transcriptional regulator
MPKVAQAHLDARRQQIVDAARARFAGHGFARTSMADIVAESGLSTGAIYRYFKSKDELVFAVCAQLGDAFPADLSFAAIDGFLQRLRTVARDQGQARLTVQVYAEAALSPALAAVLEAEQSRTREAVAELVRAGGHAGAPAEVAEAFVAVCNGFTLQLAVRGDLDTGPFTRALLAITGPAGAHLESTGGA